MRHLTIAVILLLASVVRADTITNTVPIPGGVVGTVVVSNINHTATTPPAVEYSFSSNNAPIVGSFSWTVIAPNFITNDIFISPFAELSTSPMEPGDPALSLVALSNPVGCGISVVNITAGLGLDTLFSPLCHGADSTTAGIFITDNTFGTWQWSGTNPDDTFNVETLTISDPAPLVVGTPEPNLSKTLFVCLITLFVIAAYKRLGRIL